MKRSKKYLKPLGLKLGSKLMIGIGLSSIFLFNMIRHVKINTQKTKIHTDNFYKKV